MTNSVTRRTVAGGGTLKLREGGWYRNRQGELRGPVVLDARDGRYPFSVTDFERTRLDTSWLETGDWHRFAPPHAFDLVEEVDPPE